MLATRALGTRVATERPSAERVSRVVVVALALTPPLTQLLFLLLNDRDQWFQLFSDDAFYYFGVARNIATGDGSTFTGLVETNGYHPLWTLTLSALATVARTPASFVIAVVVLQSFIWVGVVREGLRIGRAVGSEAAAVAGLVALGFLAVLTGQLSFNGMESAPLLFFLVLAIRLFLEASEGDARRDWLLGLAFALGFLSRLDALLTIGPLMLVVVATGYQSVAVAARRMVAVAGPTAIALAAYVGVNLWLFDTPTPVSGQAKTFGSSGLNTEPLLQALQAGQVNDHFLWLGVIVIAALVLVTISGAWRATEQTRRLLVVAAAFFVGQCLLTTYLVVATTYPIWAWYHYNLAFVGFCSTVLGARWLAHRYGRRAVLAGQAVGVAFCLMVLPVTLLTNATNSPVSVRAATFVDRELPPDAVIAMGDRGGLFGYLADRPLLHLEGLVADAAWLDDLRDGTELERMNAEGVNYYVWYGTDTSDQVRLDRGICHVFPEPRNAAESLFDVTVCDIDLVYTDGSGPHWIRIWRYLPELNQP